MGALSVVAVVRIPLRARSGEVRAYAVVDAEDGHLADVGRWSLHSQGYAYRMVARRMIYLHRAVMNLEYGDGLEVDHINRDKLDCRRENLRLATRTEQMQNFEKRGDKPRGVFLDKRRGQWYGQVQVRGKKHGTGYRATQAEATAAVRELRARLMPFAVDNP